MQEFFSSPLAENAGQHLSERAAILLYVEGEAFLFQRKKSANTVRATAKKEADVHFWVPLSTMRHLLSLSREPETGYGTLGVAILEHLFHGDEAKKIRFRLDTGFLGLWSKGYFSVLKAGGPEVASYLGRWGFDSLARIKEVLRRIRP